MRKNIISKIGIWVLIITLPLFVLLNTVQIGGGVHQVADYNKRLEIWSEVAGNCSDSKIDNMSIDYNMSLRQAKKCFFEDFVGSEYKDAEKSMDTYTYITSIKSGIEKETYEDIPYLIPYLVNDGDSAVIIVPGGAFAHKSNTENNREGMDVAQTLNKNGINAFVLYYRSNPYEYPVPFLDLQRAVRYVRYHSEDFNIDKNKISVIGYSAGGTIVGTYINVIQGNNYFPSEYVLDEIDMTNDDILSAAMIYPALSFRFNVPMLFCLFDDEDVRDDKKRTRLLEMTDLSLHITSQDVRQFIAYGTEDTVVGVEETIKYINYAKDAGCEIADFPIEGQNHGFEQEKYMSLYLGWYKDNQN